MVASATLVMRMFLSVKMATPLVQLQHYFSPGLACKAGLKEQAACLKQML